MTRLTFLIVFCLVLISCEKDKNNSGNSPDQDNYGGTLRINVPENIYTLHPPEITNESEWWLAGGLFECITGTAANDINRGLIAAVRTPHPDTLYFDFEPDVVFSNGRSLDSAALHYWVNLLNTSGLRCDFVSKSRTLRIINTSYEEARRVLSRREHFLFSMDRGIPVGTGPFMLKSINEDISIDLIRNPAYHSAPLPYVDAVEIRMIKTKDTEVEEFINGSLDLIFLSPLQRLHYQNVLSLEDHSNYQLMDRKEKEYCFGLTFNMDSLEAYQLGKVVSERPSVYRLSGNPGLLSYPNLAKSTIDTKIRVDSDKSIFSQLTLEKLLEKGIALSAGDSARAGVKALYLTKGTIDAAGIPHYQKPDPKLNTADYLIIFNSWNGLAVYQYYLKTEAPQDGGMIDLKSVYFKEPIKLE